MKIKLAVSALLLIAVGVLAGCSHHNQLTEKKNIDKVSAAVLQQPNKIELLSCGQRIYENKKLYPQCDGLFKQFTKAIQPSFPGVTEADVKERQVWVNVHDFNPFAAMLSRK